MNMFKSKTEIDELFGADTEVAGLVIAICATMFDNGVRIVPVGGLMRLLGVPSEKAKKHDGQAFQLADDFYEQLEEMGFERIADNSLTIPNTTTLH